jgi:uncharacterized phage protein (TIGR01671 family)
MREILFRGKSIAVGSWLEGSLIIKDAKICYCYTIIADKNENCYPDVKPETIGQYTGLNDCKGGKIFEGDIVECDNGIEDEKFRGFIVWDDLRWGIDWGTDIFPLYFCGETDMEITIIGNKWDNTELLE